MGLKFTLLFFIWGDMGDGGVAVYKLILPNTLAHPDQCCVVHQFWMYYST